MSSEESSSRPDLYVTARIIKELRDNGSVKRTALATACGLSYDKLTKYADWMLERKLIQIDDEGYVSITKSGQEAYDRLVSWILEHVGRLRFPKVD